MSQTRVRIGIFLACLMVLAPAFAARSPAALSPAALPPTALSPTGPPRSAALNPPVPEPAPGLATQPATVTQPAPKPSLVHTRQFTVLAAGDVLLHSGFWRQAARSGGYDFRPLLAPVKADVSGADLAICHLETPLGTANGPFTGYPVFLVPPQISAALRATGYDDCDTASNHSLDGGLPGVVRTLQSLDAAGITHTGSARSATEAAQLDLLTVAGIPVAHLAYTFSFNGIPLPRDKPWLANLLDVPRILADAHRARQAGAQVVIVSLHWGTEYQHAPDAAQLHEAQTLLASPDIDLIIGCHVHVVQPMERINDKWVVYGMGNQVAWQPQRQDTRDGVMPRFTFTEVSPGRFTVTRAEAVPTFMQFDGGTATLVDLPAALADPHLPAARRAAYQASWQRTRQYLDSRGAGAAGLLVVGPDLP